MYVCISNLKDFRKNGFSISLNQMHKAKIYNNILNKKRINLTNKNKGTCIVLIRGSGMPTV